VKASGQSQRAGGCTDRFARDAEDDRLALQVVSQGGDDRQGGDQLIDEAVRATPGLADPFLSRGCSTSPLSARVARIG